MTTTEPKPLVNLTAADRCDQCGAQAYVAVKFRRLPTELLFCASHFATHGDAMKAQGGRVILDQRPEANRLLAEQLAKARAKAARKAAAETAGSL